MKPPALAAWLLGLTDCSAWNDAVAGDLLEQYQQRRSPAWYWCQVSTAVAIAVVRDVRHHWVLACRALAVAILFLNISHALVSQMGLVGWLLNRASPLIGWWPSLTFVAALEAFLTCAPAGLVVALTHRKRQATMVLVYAAGLFVFLVASVRTALTGLRRACFSGNLRFLRRQVLWPVGFSDVRGFIRPSAIPIWMVKYRN